jgi:hypothetical protein
MCLTGSHINSAVCSGCGGSGSSDHGTVTSVGLASSALADCDAAADAVPNVHQNYERQAWVDRSSNWVLVLVYLVK